MRYDWKEKNFQMLTCTCIWVSVDVQTISIELFEVMKIRCFETAEYGSSSLVFIALNNISKYSNLLAVKMMLKYSEYLIFQQLRIFQYIFLAIDSLEAASERNSISIWSATTGYKGRVVCTSASRSRCPRCESRICARLRGVALL